MCHASPVAAHYAMSLHTTKGIRCGQCHTPGGHPNFTQPIRDGKCGGCHQPQYQESLVSTHFATRALMRPGPRPGRAEGAAPARASPRPPRAAGAASWATRPRGSSAVACARRVTTTSIVSTSPSCGGTDFCTSCHGGAPGALRLPGRPTGTNRCLQCHVRVGETVTGQVVNSHRFAQAGSGGQRAVSLQESFDADLRRAMSRRQFLTRLARASGAAILISSPLGCGNAAGRDRAAAARRGGAAAQLRAAEGRGQDHRRLQPARHGDPETAGRGGSGLRSRRRLRGVRLRQRRRVPGEHAVPDRLPQRPAHVHPHVLHALPPARPLAAPVVPPRRREPLLPLPARQQPAGAAEHLHRGEVHRDGAHLHQREGGLEVHALSGPLAGGSGQARRGPRALHLLRHGPRDRRERGRAATPGRRPRLPARGAQGRHGRGRLRPPRAGDRRGGGGLGSGRLVRGRRARGEDQAAGAGPRKGRLHRADGVPPARAAHDAAHPRHGVLGASRSSAGRSPPSPPRWRRASWWAAPPPSTTRWPSSRPGP